MMKRYLKQCLTAALVVLTAVLLFTGCMSAEEKEKQSFLDWTADLLVSDCTISSSAAASEIEDFIAAVQALKPEDLEPTEENSLLNEAATLEKGGTKVSILADDECSTIVLCMDEYLWKVNSEALRKMTGRIWEPSARGIFYKETPEWEKYISKEAAAFGERIAAENGGRLEYLEKLPLGMAAERSAFELLYVGDSKTERTDRSMIVLYCSDSTVGWERIGTLTDAKVREQFDGDYREAAKSLQLEKVLSSRSPSSEA